MSRVGRFLVAAFCVYSALLTGRVDSAMNSLYVTSPGIGAVRVTCSWQALTWYQAGIKPVGDVFAFVYGGTHTQMNLGVYPNQHGYAQFAVPSTLESGLYRGRVFGYDAESGKDIPGVFDQTPWFNLLDQGCPGTMDEHEPDKPLNYVQMVGYDPEYL